MFSSRHNSFSKINFEGYILSLIIRMKFIVIRHQKHDKTSIRKIIIKSLKYKLNKHIAGYFNQSNNLSIN